MQPLVCFSDDQKWLVSRLTPTEFQVNTYVDSWELLGMM